MQISGANLLATQYTQAAAQPKAFAPLDFKQAAPQMQKPVQTQAQAEPQRPQRPGSTLDIRV